jgi:hypothetical protein
MSILSSVSVTFEEKYIKFGRQLQSLQCFPILIEMKSKFVFHLMKRFFL